MKPTTLTWPTVAPYASSCLMNTLASPGPITNGWISYTYVVADDDRELPEPEDVPKPAPARFKKIRP
jgi:hypothetical protein